MEVVFLAVHPSRDSTLVGGEMSCDFQGWVTSSLRALGVTLVSVLDAGALVAPPPCRR